MIGPMTDQPYRVIDCDGHLMESNEELGEYADDSLRAPLTSKMVKVATAGRMITQDGPFPSLDGIHNYARGWGGRFSWPRTMASEERTGSAGDWSALLDKTGIERTVIFPTRGLAVGMIRTPEYADRLCRVYNDYVHDRYRGADDRIHPMGLIPMVSPALAVEELRRVVRDLGMPGAMLPAAGLPLHLAHEFWWPVYEEAEKLGCVLALHGASHHGLGLDSFTDFVGSHILHHPVPLMYALVGLVYHGVLDRYPGLKLAFLEGGAAWLVPVLDRAVRDDEFFGRVAKRPFDEYVTSGNVLIGCEGNDVSLPYLASRVGIEPFAYSSDYPHEVDLPGAQHEIRETVESDALTDDQKRAVLSGNAARFYGF